jgi:ribonuclease G
MSKELIVSVNGREKKIAIVEDDLVTEFYVERGDENQGIVGNIYKGRVMKVLPGMQSAFVDIGLERDSFLYVSDFLDSEEFEGAFEDRKEQARPPRAVERPRPTREPQAEPAEAASEADEELHLAALRHIEEITEEPVIGASEEDLAAMEELDGAKGADATAEADPRRRRQRRLRYNAPEESPEQPAEKEAVAEVETTEGEEEGSSRRRRRPRRKRSDEPQEIAAAPASEREVITAAPDYLIEPEPIWIVQREPLERISDDEEAGEGEMLKDAIVQEKIFERIHAEEYRTSVLDLAPTPEVHVGSMRHEFSSDFERISDDEPHGEIFMTLVPEQNESALFAPTLSETAPEEASAEGGGLSASASDETGEPVTEETPLEDASAELRSRNQREEFATRRGGRGRRRGNFRRPAVSDATATGDEQGEQPQESSESPAAAPAPLARQSSERFSRPVISDLLREGQEILVQIAKEPIGQKGARITSHIALPGRYVVYMPTVEHIGVSRKIGTDDERQRLRRTLHQLRAEANIPGGFIVRTAAHGCTLEELRDDLQYLASTWNDIRKRSDRAKAPAIVHRDLDLVQRILRDQLSSDFNAIRVDNEFEYERIVDFVHRFAPKLVHRVKLYTKDNPILDDYGVQPEIDKAVKPRVWLKSGGYIVINQTEALVAIDVNTGKFVGKSNRLEDTIVKTNLEASKEIVRQIRLRDLGGIIVLDFIDMEERRNRVRVMQALEQELRNDRSPSKILQFNDFGLVAITRKRVKQSLERTLCTPCHYCGGGGMVKSAQTMCYEILAEARRVSNDLDGHNEVILRVNPEVAKAMRSTERDVFTEIEAYLGGLVTIKSDPSVHQEQFDIALV